MKNHLVLLIFCALVLGCGSNSSAGSCSGDEIVLENGCVKIATVVNSVRQITNNTISEFDLRAAMVSIKINGISILTQTWGESTRGQPASIDMHWRNGAIAISYLTTIMLQLQNQGVLSIEDKLSKWLPQYPEANQITLAMLANHTSGYADYVSILPIFENVYRQWTSGELIAAGLSQPLVCDPGTCFSYSHLNYVILGRVLSMASKKSVSVLIRDEILIPLGLHDTRSESTVFIPPPVLHAYSSSLGTYEDSTEWNPSWTLAEGAIMTTSIQDVLRSAVAVGTGELISNQAYRQMIDSYKVKALNVDNAFYGLGVKISNSWLMQDPSFYGYSGVMAYLPSKKIAIAVTSTHSDNSPDVHTSFKLFQRIAGTLVPSLTPVEMRLSGAPPVILLH